MGQSSSRNEEPFRADTEVFIPNVDMNSRSRNETKRKFNHPMAALFHIIFKFLAISFYLFGGIFGQDFMSTFVAVVLLISMDFWVVKNVTGRLLAGLRWSNYIDDEGNSHWLFEDKRKATSNSKDQLSSFQDEIKGNTDSADSSIFWAGLIVAPLFWVLLMMASIFRLNIQCFMLVSLALILSITNLYGYIRCRLGTSDIKSSVTQFVAKQVFYNFITGASSSPSQKPTA